MVTLRPLWYTFLGFVLFGGTACKKEVTEIDGLSFVNGLPYYHFTDNDRLWLQAKSGDEWKFENKQGVQHRYVVNVAQHLQAGYKISSPTLLSNKYTLVSYYDEVIVGVYGKDSSGTGYGGQFQFYRDATVTPLNAVGTGPSRFFVEGDWNKFIGNTDDTSDYANCDGLKFPGGEQLNGPFTSLTIRGRQYSDVVTFVATRRPRTCTPPNAASLKEMYYDRQAGLVRMVSVAGEVWDRVP